MKPSQIPSAFVVKYHYGMISVPISLGAKDHDGKESGCWPIVATQIPKAPGGKVHFVTFNRNLPLPSFYEVKPNVSFFLFDH